MYPPTWTNRPADVAHGPLADAGRVPTAELEDAYCRQSNTQQQPELTDHLIVTSAADLFRGLVLQR